MRRKLLLIIVLLSFLPGFSQYTKDVCSDLGVSGCSNSGAGGYLPFSSLDYNGGFYTTPNNAMPFWVAAKSVDTDLIDTTFSTSVLFELIDGPGTISGTLSFGPFLGYQYVDDWKFSEPGSYSIKMIMLGTILDTLNITVVSSVDICDPSFTKGCSDDDGDSIVFFRSSIVSVDAVFPITAGLVNKGTGFIDTTWAGTVNISKLSGPGNLWGTKHIEGSEWVMFVDLRVDLIGVYDVELEFNGNTGAYKDTVSFEAINPIVVGEVETKSLITYPNPIVDFITIQNPSDEARLTLFGLDGKMILQQDQLHKGSLKIDFSTIPNGVYFLQLVSNEGALYETIVVKIK